MNSPAQQIPPLPCSRCGGRLRKVSAFSLECESCGATSRRRPGAEQTALFFSFKLACLALGFAPAVLMLRQGMALGRFLVLNGICSVVAGLGLCARTVRWWFTLLVGPVLGGGFFAVNLMAALFVGCANGFK